LKIEFLLDDDVNSVIYAKMVAESILLDIDVTSEQVNT
jgi:hypothetical protein